MEKGLKELLESSILNEETKTALAEAWNQKLDEAKEQIREETERAIREEYATRFASDKADLVEAMDRMLTDVATTHANELKEEKQKLREERSRLTQTIKEARVEAKAELGKRIKALESFVLSQLKDELTELAEDHKALQEQRVQLRKSLSEHRRALTEQTEQAVQKLEKFVVKQLTKEVAELETDKRALVEARVKMTKEAKDKLDETRKAFIARATRIVESTVDAHLRKELTQLKDDLREARENLFGRRLFEAFQTEFMASYMNENKEFKQLTKKLDETRKQAEKALKLYETQKQLNEQMERRVKISEERARRERTLNELLSPLSKDKRQVMGELLEGVKTEVLKEAFHRYLPAVLNETAKGRETQGRRILSETTKRKEFTGNRVNRLVESARAEDTQENIPSEIIELRRLAGIEK